MSQITESDWKKFKQVRELALQRFCEKVVLDLQVIASDTKKSAHERYLEIYTMVEDRDEDMAFMFNDPRRSNAGYQLASMHSRELLTSEEIAMFSEELRSRLRS